MAGLLFALSGGGVKHQMRACSAQFAVARIFNLPYRRIEFCDASILSALPIKNRRYGRLQICVTVRLRRLQLSSILICSQNLMQGNQ
jgi:hypothetical protein